MTAKTGGMAGGWYRVKCFQPYQVLDVPALAHLYRGSGVHLPALPQGLVTHRQLLELRQKMPAREYRQVEQCLVGGGLRWQEEMHNLLVKAGRNYLLSAGLKGGTQLSAWYLGLMNATPIVDPDDTMATHGGWTENENYSESTRQQWIGGAVANESVDNTAMLALFTINTNGQSLGGPFLASSNVKGGPSGTLYSAVAFTGGNKPADANDVIQVSYTLTMADDGV